MSKTLYKSYTNVVLNAIPHVLLQTYVSTFPETHLLQDQIHSYSHFPWEHGRAMYASENTNTHLQIYIHFYFDLNMYGNV